MPPRRRQSQRAVLEKYGVRSGLELDVCRALDRQGIAYAYESFAIPFLQPAKPRKYTPDILLLNNGIVIETKGRFETADRQKHLLVQKQYPDLDLRFVFSNPNQRISKQSKTTYALWCETNGFLYAKVSIPPAWLAEPPNRKSLAVVRQFMGET